MDAFTFFISFLIAVAVQVVAYLLAPKPKQPKPEAARDLEAPTADASRPIPVIFGTITVKGLNVLHTADKQVVEYEVRV